MYANLQQCKNQLDGIQAIDYFLARQVCNSLQKAEDELLFHSIMATSQALRNGHSCLKIAAEANKLCWENEETNKPGYLFPDALVWQEYLSCCGLDAENNHPLVYQFQRLYLRRYWLFEQQLSESIALLINQPLVIDVLKATQVVQQLFPAAIENKEFKSYATELDWQQIAVANTLDKQFSIIAGGPGTGKTFTVTKVMAALQSLFNSSTGKWLNIAMVAPTGKAAMRLNESINKAKHILQQQQLISIATLEVIPDTATTIHRLLGVKRGSHNFRYNESRKLPYDVILVDEISMIDLPLMCRLFRALNESCQIIMLGDADQLPSVAAGSILSDLAPQQSNSYSLANSKNLQQLTGFKITAAIQKNLDHLTVLQKSFRFDSGGEIAQLASDVIAGEEKKSWLFLNNAKKQLLYIQGISFLNWIDSMLEQYYLPLFRTNKNQPELTIEMAFLQLNQFRFLAATRKGEQGIELINDYIEQYLAHKGFIPASQLALKQGFYHGCPIMVTENDYQLGLYNGDTGLIWLKQGKLYAAFPANPVRWINLSRLPAVETVYAMTIHKTQGSEFTHVALVLPAQDSPILSRELLYTGITRASDKLSIWAAQSIWNIAVKRKVQRYSGLQQRIFDKD
ncbi:MAG: exodeoxyribonuclease V subunit alpha [Pseudomonadota bacterium]